jgi:hypothetical protein
MKNIKNQSTQGLEIFLTTEIGPKTHWIAPREVIQVPASYISSQLQLMHQRKLIKIF